VPRCDLWVPSPAIRSGRPGRPQLSQEALSPSTVRHDPSMGVFIYLRTITGGAPAQLSKGGPGRRSMAGAASPGTAGCAGATSGHPAGL
jgi:hypothetical protein